MASEKSSKDPDLADWCDFARGVADETLERELSELLESGNERARHQAGAMAIVQNLAEREKTLTPPSHAVRMARALMGACVPAEPAPPRWTPFELLYDSQLEPATAGTRNIHSATREIHGRWGEYFVDVRRDEQGLTSRQVIIVGELLKGIGVRHPLPNVPVVIRSRDRVIATTTTSSFGEFQAEVEVGGDLVVSFVVSDTECLRALLPASHQRSE